jgi:Uma2 family endonuclease
MPELKKAELIEGVVYMPSPVRLRQHGQPHGLIAFWLGLYAAATPGVQLCIDTTIRLDLENEMQPDALLRIAGTMGTSRITADDYLEGAPELVVEIAASSASRDLHTKLRAYRRNGVQEYMVWKVLEQEIVWFYLQKGEYQLLSPDPGGILKSQFFPGLWLNPEILLATDLTAVSEMAAAGINTPAHAEFKKQLT